MNFFYKVLVSCIVCIAVLLSLTSCGLVEWIQDVADGSTNEDIPDGYTGGINTPANFFINMEIYWVETFEEAENIIEQLKIYGNEIPNNIISSYENESVDAKYCFIVNTYKTPNVKEGEEWYQRKFRSIESVRYYAFLDDISIEELTYSYVSRYRSIELRTISLNENNLGDVLSKMTFDCNNDGSIGESDGDSTCRIINNETDETVAGMYYYNIENHSNELSGTFHEDFIKTIIVVGDV